MYTEIGMNKKEKKKKLVLEADFHLTFINPDFEEIWHYVPTAMSSLICGYNKNATPDL